MSRGCGRAAVYTTTTVLFSYCTRMRCSPSITLRATLLQCPVVVRQSGSGHANCLVPDKPNTPDKSPSSAGHPLAQNALWRTSLQWSLCRPSAHNRPCRITSPHRTLGQSSISWMVCGSASPPSPTCPFAFSGWLSRDVSKTLAYGTNGQSLVHTPRLRVGPLASRCGDLPSLPTASFEAMMSFASFVNCSAYFSCASGVSEMV